MLLIELMSGLNANFHKSLMVWINIAHNWLEETTNILNSKIGSFPFKYLGLSIESETKIYMAIGD